MYDKAFQVAVVLATVSGVAQAAPVSPTYSSFAMLSAPELAVINFNGSGLADAGPVALTTFSRAEGTVYLALSATPRVKDAYVGPAVGNDGAGTYFAQTGASPALGSNNAAWNFNFAVVGNTSGLTLKLFVDADPAAGTDRTAHLLAPFGGSSTMNVQDSQNLGFDGWGFHAFDPYQLGEYTFSIQAFQGSTALGEVAMRVSVVPEPEAYGLALAGLAVVGVGAVVGRRRKTAA